MTMRPSNSQFLTKLKSSSSDSEEPCGKIWKYPAKYFIMNDITPNKISLKRNDLEHDLNKLLQLGKNGIS